MIHVCFGLHDATERYSKFTGTTICSIFANTNSEVTAHILHDSTLTQDNREKFLTLTKRCNQRVKFYNVEILYADKLNAIKKNLPNALINRYSIATFYRLLIPQILPVDINKCIYLDSDMLVNLDINELWQIDLGDKPLASVPESKASEVYFKIFGANKYIVKASFVKFEDYFNSALLILNLRYFRKAYAKIMTGVKFRGEHPQCDCFDQDIWNYLFAKNYLKLPGKFDRFTGDERLLKKSSKIQRVIYHFAGTDRNTGLTLNMDDKLNELWMSYFMKTPFFDADSIGRLFDGFQQIHVGLKNSMIQVSAMMSGKTRAFFTAPNNCDAVKKIFSVRDDEQIVLAENQESLKKFLDAMKKTRGKKVFFIMLPNFPFNLLTQTGFQPGKDFINGFDFLSEAHGVPLNSYPLIKAM